MKECGGVCIWQGRTCVLAMQRETLTASLVPRPSTTFKLEKEAKWKLVMLPHLCCIGDTLAPWMVTCCRPGDRMSQNSDHTVCVYVGGGAGERGAG